MKKSILSVLITLCFFNLIGQPSLPLNVNHYLFPPCIQNGTLPILQSANNSDDYSIYSTVQIKDPHNTMHESGFTKIAQPYYIDTFVSVQALSICVAGAFTCSAYLEIQQPLGNRIVAALRYDTVTNIGVSNYDSLRFTELFFDSNIFIKGLFYVVADVPRDMFAEECSSMAKIWSSLINKSQYNNKPDQLCCEDLPPFVLEYDGSWYPFGTSEIYNLFGVVVDSGCYPFIYLFPILGENVYTHATISDTNDSIQQTINVNISITDFGHPIPSFVGFIYDTISTETCLSFANPNKMLLPFDSTINDYNFTILYNQIDCNKNYYYRYFFINALDTSYGEEIGSFIKQCDNVLDDISNENTVKIYPNPAKNELFIQSDFKVITLEIYNNLGVKVKEIELNRHEAKIDIANLLSGNYTLKLLTTQGEVKKKIVIK
ncbi:MAG: T9SS type A sorting domain-containing protein [Bacteroidales bacterium]|jgi:hypothetical protein|nr:T9SS type A sorting domain-containing protein [Bacteroidales bacterium]